MMSGLEAALAEASSPSWSQRARAGCGLASFVDVPEAAEALAGLLLDAEDTAVTRRTAEALARVGTVAAVRLIARAVAEADDNHADWLQTGVQDALVGPDRVPDVAAVCGRLAHHPEEAVRRGASEIRAWSDDASRYCPRSTGV
ncbi:HEAT repeat domain-containing protein [Streptomyces sp. BRA346]|uniref:HEAT repeat domain-containing protein n=1 Tax=Streptomyces sp. BRA346 TaxID=2878199 RepID=UPI0040648226